MLDKLKSYWSDYKYELGNATDSLARNFLLSIIVAPMIIVFLVLLFVFNSESDHRRIKDLFNPNEIQVEVNDPLNINLVSIYWNTEILKVKHCFLTKEKTSK